MSLTLIVGSRGQDGRLLGDLLAARGCEVAGLSRQGLTLPDGRREPPTDVADPEAVAGLVRRLSPGRIYYLAAFHHSSQDARSIGGADLWRASLEVNVLGPTAFLEAMHRHAPQTRFFLAGSCLAYGQPVESPQTEETPFRPVCAYGVSKTAASHTVRMYREKRGLFAAAGILYNHESHLRPERFLSRKIVRAARRIQAGLQEELVLANLSARADWGYAPDFVEAFRLALEAPEPDDYVVATGQTHGVMDWVKKSFALAGLDWHNHVREDASLTVRSRPPLTGDVSRIRARLGWTPTTSFERMVELMFEREDIRT